MSWPGKPGFKYIGRDQHRRLGIPHIPMGQAAEGQVERSAFEVCRRAILDCVGGQDHDGLSATMA